MSEHIVGVKQPLEISDGVNWPLQIIASFKQEIIAGLNLPL